MPEAEYSTTARLPVAAIWGYVREMDNWAPFLRGYQSHEKQSDTDSTWVLKGDVGMVTRTVKFHVHIDEWGEPSRVRFTLKGVNEPMQGGGEFLLEPYEDASAAAAAPRRAEARPLRAPAALALSPRRTAAPSAPRARTPGPGAGMSRLSFRLRIKPGGPMGPMVDALMKPLMLPVAEELADRIMAELEKRHARRNPEPRSHAMVEYDPFLPQVIEDPQPVYAKLREEAPCCLIPKYDTYFLSRFEDIWNASMDAKSYSTEAGTTFAQLVKKIQPVTPMINNMDPPRHTHLRSKIVPYFTPGGVRKLEPQIAKFVADAFAEVKRGEAGRSLQRLRRQGVGEGRLPRERLPDGRQRHAERAGLALLRPRGRRRGHDPGRRQRDEGDVRLLRAS